MYARIRRILSSTCKIQSIRFDWIFFPFHFAFRWLLAFFAHSKNILWNYRFHWNYSAFRNKLFGFHVCECWVRGVNSHDLNPNNFISFEFDIKRCEWMETKKTVRFAEKKLCILITWKARFSRVHGKTVIFIGKTERRSKKHTKLQSSLNCWLLLMSPTMAFCTKKKSAQFNINHTYVMVEHENCLFHLFIGSVLCQSKERARERKRKNRKDFVKRNNEFDRVRDPIFA